jgi:hypothetical protein
MALGAIPLIRKTKSNFYSKRFDKIIYIKPEAFTINHTVMTFTKLVPNIFYKDIKSGLKTFVDCLEFTIGHNEIETDRPFCVLEKDGLRVNLFQNRELAEKDNPEFRLVTENIEDVFAKVSSNFPELLHPNLNQITLRPWGAREFALMDDQIGIVIQQW